MKSGSRKARQEVLNCPRILRNSMAEEEQARVLRRIMVLLNRAIGLISPLFPRFGALARIRQELNIIRLPTQSERDFYKAGSFKIMHRLLYMSSESMGFSRLNLRSVLEASLRNNTSLNVTGILLYKAGNFLQVLEGDQTVVENLFGKICLDSRHHGVTTLIKEDVPEREFRNWSMAFRDMDMEEEKSHGFSRLLNSNQPETGQFSRGIRVFMRMFESAC